MNIGDEKCRRIKCHTLLVHLLAQCNGTNEILSVEVDSLFTVTAFRKAPALQLCVKKTNVCFRFVYPKLPFG
jgi:hypothetical protein